MIKRSLIGFVLVVLATTSQAGQYNSVLTIGDSMPSFSQLPKAGGGTLSSTDLSEDVIVLVSLANHCPWVKGMDPDLVKLTDLFNDQSVRVVGLSVNHRDDDRLPAMAKHARANGYNFDYVYDESQELGRELGATRTPEYFVFNKERTLVYMGLLYDSPAKLSRDGERRHIAGEPTEFYVRDAIEQTLSGTVVKVAETRAHGCSVKYQQTDDA